MGLVYPAFKRVDALLNIIKIFRHGRHNKPHQQEAGTSTGIAFTMPAGSNLLIDLQTLYDVIQYRVTVQASDMVLYEYIEGQKKVTQGSKIAGCMSANTFEY